MNPDPSLIAANVAGGSTGLDMARAPVADRSFAGRMTLAIAFVAVTLFGKGASAQDSGPTREHGGRPDAGAKPSPGAQQRGPENHCEVVRCEFKADLKSKSTYQVIGDPIKQVEINYDARLQDFVIKEGYFMRVRSLVDGKPGKEFFARASGPDGKYVFGQVENKFLVVDVGNKQVFENPPIQRLDGFGRRLVVPVVNLGKDSIPYEEIKVAPVLPSATVCQKLNGAVSVVQAERGQMINLFGEVRGAPGFVEAVNTKLDDKGQLQVVGGSYALRYDRQTGMVLLQNGQVADFGSGKIYDASCRAKVVARGAPPFWRVLAWDRGPTGSGQFHEAQFSDITAAQWPRFAPAVPAPRPAK